MKQHKYRFQRFDINNNYCLIDKNFIWRTIYLVKKRKIICRTMSGAESKKTKHSIHV